MMLAAPMLARIYGPAEIGLYAVFASVASVIMTVSCMRYEMTIPVVSQNDLPSAIFISFIAAIFMSLIIALIIPCSLLFSGTPLNKLGINLWLFSLLAVMQGLAQIGTYLSIRFATFRAFAFYKFSQPLLFIILAVLLPDIGLSVAYTLSFMTVLLFIFFYRAQIPATLTSTQDFAKKHKQYTFALMPATFMDAAATALPIIFIGNSYGTASAGSFSIIQKLTAGPLIIFASAVGQIFFGVCSEKVRNGFATTSIVQKSLLLLGLPIFSWLILVFIVGEHLLGKILGSGWQTNTAYIMLVMAPFIVRVLVSPLSTLLIAVNKQRTLFYWQVSYFVSCSTVLLWGTIKLDYLKFLKLYGVHESIFYVLYLFLIYSSSKRYSMSLKGKFEDKSCLYAKE